MAKKKYDFAGWATRCNIKCSDGRTIKPGAFKEDSGKTVPLVWMHMHDDPENVLGHAYLEDRGDEGVYAYCTLNNTPKGKAARDIVKNGDVAALSIYANQLQQNNNKDVLHGCIREVSLVLAGANKGATIIEHGEDFHGDDAIIMSEFPNNEGNIDDESGEYVEHVAKEEPEEEPEKEEKEVTDNNERTVKDVYDGMTQEQKDVVAFLVGQAVQDAKSGKDSDDDEDYEDEDEEMVEHGVFDQDQDYGSDFISHADQGEILGEAKKPGMTLQSALQAYAEDNGIAHADAADAVSGFDDADKVFDNRTSLNLMFPDFREANGNMPELITSDQGWITTVLAKVHKAPFSRVRTSEVDIRELPTLRAKGYKKGTKKALSGNFKLIRRTTDPQTVYVRSSLNRDDIVDITDFDYVQYQYNIDKLMLNEEVATAIMLGDFREDEDAAKIMPEHIRPIWTDDDLFVKHVPVDIAAAKKELQGSDTGVHFGNNYVYAEAVIEALLHARETNFRGTGTPDFYCTPALMNTMLLARDYNGRRIYGSKAELQSALNIGQMITAEQFTDKVRTASDGKKYKLLGIVGNLNDYQVGSTKGGEIQHFTDFDIDFNQEKSLIETRLSGAVTRIYSFIVLEEEVDSTTPSTAEAQG